MVILLLKFWIFFLLINKIENEKINLGSTTPPPTSAASTQQTSTPSILQDSNRAVTKVKKFLGALVQFSQDTSPDRGDRVRALILSLAV